jgi:hypothetical protein
MSASPGPWYSWTVPMPAAARLAATLAATFLLLVLPVPSQAVTPDADVRPLSGSLARSMSGSLAGSVAGPGPSSPGSLPGDTIPSAEEVARLLGSQDSRDQGLQAIILRASSLPTDRATLWIQLLATAERTGVEAGGLAARAVARADGRDAPGGVALLLEGMEGGLPEEDRAPLLALASHLLTEPDPVRAAELRRRLIQEWPEALEVPEAQVQLARHLLDQGGEAARGEAVEVLEALLLRRPNHPLAPEARRLRQGALRPGS